MKITDVKAMTLKGYKQWNYVQIQTDTGLTGIGEAHPGPGIAEIILQFKNRLVGADPRKYRASLQPIDWCLRATVMRWVYRLSVG